jgi:hypothetical protein
MLLLLRSGFSWGMSTTNRALSNRTIGVAGLELAADSYDLGGGVRLFKSYAHLAIRPRISFTPSSGRRVHPGPWKPLKTWLFGGPAGSTITVLASIFVPSRKGSSPWENGGFWIVFLLGLQMNSNLAVAYFYDESSDSSSDGERDIRMLLEEFLPHTHSVISHAQIQWVRDNWLASLKMIENPAFAFAAQVLLRDHMLQNQELQIVSVWSALERIFSSKAPELRFRVSANIASYLEPNSPARRSLVRSTLKLYDERSAAAHGSPLRSSSAYMDSVGLLRRTLIKMIEQRHVPTSDELEKHLFE